MDAGCLDVNIMLLQQDACMYIQIKNIPFVHQTCILIIFLKICQPSMHFHNFPTLAMIHK